MSDLNSIQAKTAFICGMDGVIYQGALVAVRHNRVLKAFYDHLLSKGKAKKVALVACMHKLLRILNAMVRDGTPWIEPTTLQSAIHA